MQHLLSTAMNPRRILPALGFVLAAALCAPALPATEATAPVAFRINQVAAEKTSIERGTAVRDVQAALGEPYRRLSSEIHLFTGYHADLPESDKLGCDTLVIVYAQGKVSDLKLVNNAALKVIASHLKNTAFDSLVAVKDDRTKPSTPIAFAAPAPQKP